MENRNRKSRRRRHLLGQHHDGMQILPMWRRKVCRKHLDGNLGISVSGAGTDSSLLHVPVMWRKRPYKGRLCSLPLAIVLTACSIGISFLSWRRGFWIEAEMARWAKTAPRSSRVLCMIILGSSDRRLKVSSYSGLRPLKLPCLSTAPFCSKMMIISSFDL